MKNLICVLTMSMVCVAGSVQADTITMDAANSSRIYSSTQNGEGNTLGTGAIFIGTKANSAGFDGHGGYCFQMTGAIADATSADFSVSRTGGQGTMAYNVDVYVNRVSDTTTFLISDFQNGEKIMDDFVTASTAEVGQKYSLNTDGRANLLTYLEKNWVEGDYVFITLKANTDDALPTPFVMGEDADANWQFGSAPDATDAQLSVTDDILVFSEDFNGQSITKYDIGPVVFGGASPEVSVGEWFAAANYVAINNELQLTNYGASRSRGAGVWLDSSGWDIGTVTVKFDVLDYVAGGVDSESFFQAYYANGVDAANSVSIDVHGGGGEDPAIASTGSATIGTIGARNTITTNVTDAEFTFDFTGQENIALVFHNKSALDDTTMPVYSVDNLTAINIPAPAGTMILIQ